MAIKQGTGFTNINRILQANRGSKLGGAVSGGISGQVQNVQSGVKSAQQQFEEEANKKRLDTDEAKQQRQSVLGKFDESNYQPDMSKFAASSGLQQGYDASKQKLEQEKAAKQAEVEAAKTQQAQFGTQLGSLQQKLDQTPEYNTTRLQQGFLGLGTGTHNEYYDAKIKNQEFTNLQNQIKGLKSQSDALNPVVGTDFSTFDTRGTELQSQYDKQKQAEQDAFQKAERAKLVAANLPTDQDISDFTRFRTGTYTGPNQLGEAGSLLSQAQQAESLGNLAKTSGGRQELLRQFVGGRDYTQGQKNLDSLILGQDPTANIGAAARQTRGAVEGVQQANREAASKATEYVNRANEFGAETRGIIDQTKTPISGGLDARLAELQNAETARQTNIKSIQDMLIGQDEKFAGMDKLTRAGIALQSAANAGYLNQGDINMLLGTGDQTGLLQRGLNLGLDVNQLINERITNKAAENLSRTGVASDEDVARINALDRLAGKTGTDLEFLDSRGRFQAGKGGLDIGGLEEYISRAENQKAASDKEYADKLAAEKARYLNQTMAYGQGVLGDYTNVLANTYLTPGGLAGVFGGPGLQVGADVLTGGDSFAQTGQAVGSGVLNAAGAGAQAQNALMEGLLKLNVGGKSIANTEAGQQLLKAIDYLSKNENKAIAGTQAHLTDYTSNFGDLTKNGLNDLLHGNVSALGENFYGLGGGKNIERAIGDIGGALGIKGVSTKSIKKKIKKMFSDKDLKEDIEYNPKDVQKFMDRLKPASYNYKEEVKNDPRASKNRELGVMAQDLEKSKLGKESVHDTPKGKIVDYDNLEPKMLASLASLNERLKRIEGKK